MTKARHSDCLHCVVAGDFKADFRAVRGRRGYLLCGRFDCRMHKLTAPCGHVRVACFEFWRAGKCRPARPHPNCKPIDAGKALRLIGDPKMSIRAVAGRLGINVDTLYGKFPVAEIRCGRRCNAKPFDVAPVKAALGQSY